VTVKAAYSKRRRDDVQPIRRDLAEALRPWLADKPADAPVFQIPDKRPPMLRADLRRARAHWIRSTNDRALRRERRGSDFLREVDREGRVVDFHALRSTYITMLVKGGATMKEAQDLARHSDPKLTLNVYTMLNAHDLAGALGRLPAVDPVQSERDAPRVTGTASSRAFCCGRSVNQRPQYTTQRQREGARNEKTERDLHTKSDVARGARKSLPRTDKDNAARSCAASCNTATQGTRTPDLSFTKAPLYRLS
jgi:hypothetical protein